MRHILLGHVSRIYIATIFLSAALLFSIQPMIAKMALPLLGGTPAVWAISMCVFQGLLLAGYCYAHILSAYLPARTGAIVHLAVLAIAAATLPITLRATSSGAPQGGYELWLIRTLILSIGLPFFALAANAPLLQRWYSRLGRADSADPYRLYVASNAGSLISLLAYPFVLEPLLTLTTQRTLWTSGFFALIALIGASAYALTSAPQINSNAYDASRQATGTDITMAARMGWLAYALVPSGLLVAFTTFLTTDLASAPLLWVIPLALYLATFLIVFRDNPPVGTIALARVTLIAVATTLLALEWNGTWTWALSAISALTAFVAASLLCHRALYERRPPAAHLTEFYLWMSLGGVLGGIAAALIAPLIFIEVIEFPLLLGLAILLGYAHLAATATGPLANARSRIEWTAIAALLAAVLLIGTVATLTGWMRGIDSRFWVIAALAALIGPALLSQRLATGIGLAMVTAAVVIPAQEPPFHAARSFFGTHRVLKLSSGRVHTLLHGTTLHGAEIRLDASGHLIDRPTPVTYYHPSGPIARSVLLARVLSGSMQNPVRAGVIGLGTGAIACYATAADTWRFFELDPDVIRIARNPDYFRYLSICQPKADIVLGDARQTTALEPDAVYDYILLDAFSSDAIPVHLLTREAITQFLAKLTPRGLLTLHVSNQNLDLIPSIEATLATIPGMTAVYTEGVRGPSALASQVVLVSRDEKLVTATASWPKVRQLGPTTTRGWTDDYSDIIGAMISKIRSKLNPQP